MHYTARVTKAFRRAVLRLFVRLKLFDEEQAARYCARNPVALERLTYDRVAKAAT